MLIRLDPPIPMRSPKGPCLAHFLIDDGAECDLKWVTFQDNTGECWTWKNSDIRAQKNVTLGREHVSPFYDPESVKLKKPISINEDGFFPPPWNIYENAEKTEGWLEFQKRMKEDPEYYLGKDDKPNFNLCDECKKAIENCPLGQGKSIEICESCSLNDVSDYIAWLRR